MNNKCIVLASSSPRRKDLMAQNGFDFEVVPSAYDEPKPIDEKPEEYALAQAAAKAYDVAQKKENAIVIGADTVVAINNRILGKPHTSKKARDMLKLLSGKTHEVITGYCIIDTTTKETVLGSATGIVTIRDLDNDDIDRYVETKIPLDKAGAYAIQEDPVHIVQSSKGDIEAIIGLPMTKILPRIKQFQSI